MLEFFLQNRKKGKTEIFAFCVITFEPIKIQSYFLPQSDYLNRSYVKYIHVAGEKIPKNCLKVALYHSQILGNNLYK